MYSGSFANTSLAIAFKLLDRTSSNLADAVHFYSHPKFQSAQSPTLIRLFGRNRCVVSPRFALCCVLISEMISDALGGGGLSTRVRDAWTVLIDNGRVRRQRRIRCGVLHKSTFVPDLNFFFF
uniref:(northern house mosquito) hypothetical protein n=1 Tax=Culex pipiens TaxID=7175 RepID=A0A8D7ZY21_CULPI